MLNFDAFNVGCTLGYPRILEKLETFYNKMTRSPAVCWDMADRTAHSRRSVQMPWRIHLAMLIYRDRWVKVKIRISVRV